MHMEIQYCGDNKEMDNLAISDLEAYVASDGIMETLRETVEKMTTASDARAFIISLEMLLGVSGRAVAALLRKHNLPVFRAFVAEMGHITDSEGFIIELGEEKVQ